MRPASSGIVCIVATLYGKVACVDDWCNTFEQLFFTENQQTYHEKVEETPPVCDEVPPRVLMFVCAMTHPLVWHASSTCVTWLIHLCDMTLSNVSRDSLMRVTWDRRPHAHVWHDLFTCVAWLICDLTHSYVWHDSFICVPWLSHTWDVLDPRVWYDTFVCVTYHIDMGWLRLAGSLKL